MEGQRHHHLQEPLATNGRSYYRSNSVSAADISEVTGDDAASESSRSSFNSVEEDLVVDNGSLKKELFFENGAVPRGPSLENLHKGSAFRRDNSTSPQLLPNVPAKDSPFYSNIADPQSPTLKNLSIPKQSKANYTYSEMDFVMALVNIGDRLRSVPKEMRQNSLIAELSLLNHNLPAEVCIPMWCNATAEEPYHHRVLRISTDDCVILNSADRVPYLICIEISENGHWTDETHDESNTSNFDQKDTFRNVSPSSSPTSPTSASQIISHRSSRQFPRRTSSLFDADLSTLSRRITSVKLNEESEKAQNLTVLAKLNEFADRTRTAAVMMAQLYQQQIRDVSSDTPPETINSHDTFAVPRSQSQTIPRSAVQFRNNSTHVTTATTNNPFPASTSSPSLSTVVSTSPKQSFSAPSSPRTSASHTRALRTTTQKVSSFSRPDNKRSNVHFEEIRQRLIKEMLMIEEQREQLQMGLSDDVRMQVQGDKAYGATKNVKNEDPSAAVFKESWATKQSRIKANSPFKSDKSWQLVSVIVKSGADLRQEHLAIQLIREFQRIWMADKVPIWVHCFKILVTSGQSGLIETIKNSVSVHSIKKSMGTKADGTYYGLYDYFLMEYGPPESDQFQAAQDNFMRSLAGYSIISYILQLKDRHNGNILVDSSGHLIHIDFGFMLSNSPGSMGFELAPFKLSQEYIEILGGLGSEKFQDFRNLMKEGFLSIRKKVEGILLLVEIMEEESLLPCFTGASTKPSTVYIPPSASSYLLSLPSFGFTSRPTTEISATSTPSQRNRSNTDPISSTNTPPANSESVQAVQTPLPQSNGTSPRNTVATSSSLFSGASIRNPVTAALKERFFLGLSDSQLCDMVDKLIESSGGNIFTRLYDSFQYYSNGVM
ncbi:Phosphatidylinositol 4-kinase pik1alpha (PI4-kinase)(PtdIns-4-kinase) [Nowakowskiella sp. JEL0407]|nr:Phosphatidylinositol 4-kinase pik1alpha (PI4-kinase)(PtdIns-4-kinase) [Nowakowskiella sp. JEL0407]